MKVALVGGFLAFVGTLSSAFISSPMLLYLSFGALVGSGFAFTLSLVILCHYFHRRLGLVFSLMSFGGGAFTVMLSLVFPSLFDRIGLRNSLLVLSGLHSLLLLYAATWGPSPSSDAPAVRPSGKPGRRATKRRKVEWRVQHGPRASAAERSRPWTRAVTARADGQASSVVRASGRSRGGAGC